MIVRRANLDDHAELVALRAALWPDAPRDENRAEVRGILSGQPPSTLPLTCFVAASGGRLLGFVEVGLRSHADGCNPAQPCGFIEGWYVRPEAAGAGVGRALIARAEAWARDQGCVELASDTWTENRSGIEAHLAVGFEEVDRCTNFRKSIPAAPLQGRPPESLHGVDSVRRLTSPGGAASPYGADLALLHHAHFGGVAQGAAATLVESLSDRGIPTGTVVELGCGSGISSRILADAGYAVVGVDSSEPMLRLAREEAPGCRFVRGSLWDFPLPRCVAVTAVGEAFCYAAAGDAPDESLLRARLAEIRACLVDDGVLLFDIAGPGRSGPRGKRQSSWEHAGSFVCLDEQEDASRRELSRTIDTFVPAGSLHRHRREVHRLRLFDPAAIEAALAGVGFAVERVDRYGSFDLGTGWFGFLARA